MCCCAAQMPAHVLHARAHTSDSSTSDTAMITMPATTPRKVLLPEASYSSDLRQHQQGAAVVSAACMHLMASVQQARQAWQPQQHDSSSRRAPWDELPDGHAGHDASGDAHDAAGGQAQGCKDRVLQAGSMHTNLPAAALAP